MRSVVVWLVLLSLPLQVVAQQQSAPETRNAVSVCTVTQRAIEYDGKEIVVTGEYQRVFHGAVLSSPECSHTRVSVRFAPTAADEKGRMKKLGRAAEKRRSADVIFRGVF